MRDVAVIESPAAAAAALDPMRGRILAELRTPSSAASLAKRLGSTRQKVNYHLRELERHGLVVPAGEKAHGGLTERLFEAAAASHVISPDAMGATAPDPAKVSDRLSARYLIALASRIVGEVGDQLRRAEAADKRVATLAIDASIAFATPEDQARFADEVTQTVNRLAAKYHHDGGRRYRMVVAAHPQLEE